MNKTNKNKINFLDDDRLVLICAFRYALGRMTYVVGVVVEIIHKNWDKFDDSTKGLFSREILEHQRMFNSLGHDCDTRDWMSIVDRYNLEEANKFKNEK
jgi:hypothetical protein